MKNILKTLWIALLFIPVLAISESFTITFETDGGSPIAPITQDEGTAVTRPADPTKTDYTFLGWVTDVPSTMPDGDMTCVAQWAMPLSADVNLRVGRYNTTTKVFTPLAPGETIVANEIIAVRIVPTTDYLVGASNYVVMFDKELFLVMGSNTTAFIVNKDPDNIVLNDVTMEWELLPGYNGNYYYDFACTGFSGATTIPEGSWPASFAAGERYDKYIAIKVGAQADGNSKLEGEPLVIPGEYSDWLFQFRLKAVSDIVVGTDARIWMDARWFRSSTNPGVDGYIPKCLTGDLVSNAKTTYPFNFDFSGADIKLALPGAPTSTIFFNVYGGSPIAPITGDEGSAVTAPADPTKTGFTFKGWSPAIPGTFPVDDLTCVAQWEAIPNPTSTISFDMAGGSPAIAPITGDEGSAVTAPADPTKTGYTFTGWSPAIPATFPIDDLTCFAQWEAISNPTSTISFDMADGSPAIAPITQDEGTAVTAPADPTKDGYTFTGWDPEIPSTMPVDDLTCVAQWEAIPTPTSTISFDMAGGSPAIAPITQDEGTAVTAPADPTKEGYTFTGWDPEIPATMPVDDLTCVAQWEASTTCNDAGIVWTDRTAAEANIWTSVVYGNGLFVAVANDGTNGVMTSPDGITWTARTAAEANTWNSVTYGNGLFVAVSAQGTNRVMTSPDGINWTARTVASSNWTSVTYGDGLFVAVAAQGTNRVMTSTDGFTWTVRNAAAASNWWSVTYGNGFFVAVASGGTNRVMTSPDGFTWTAQTAAEANYWYSVAYNNGVFVAVASSGTNRVMTSPEGINWTARPAAASSDWRSVTFGNGLFVAVALSGTYRVMTSPDGIFWTARAAAENYSWTSVTYGNGLFVAVAYDGTKRVMTSHCTTYDPSTITFNVDGGSAVAPITQTKGSRITAPSDPTKDGFFFAGWNPIIPAKMPVNDLTCVAQWMDAATGTIVVYGAGSTVVNGTYVYTEDYPIQGLTAAYRNLAATMLIIKWIAGGDLPAGWFFINSAFNDIYYMAPLTDGVIPPTTGWQSVMSGVDPPPYFQGAASTSTITFDMAGGSPAIAPITQDEGTAVTAPADPTKDGYTFTGWDPEIPATMPVDDLTCVAQWEENPILTVTTQAVGDITATSGIGNGTITIIGSGNATNRGVIHYPFTDSDLEIDGTDVTNVDEDGDFGTGPFTASFTGLSVNTRYNARAYATNVGDGIAYGSRVDFWTLANVPSAPTVNNPDFTSLDVTINVNGNPASTEFAIHETTTNQFVQANGTLGVSVVWVAADTWGTKTVTDLLSNTQYTFEVKARNGGNVETAYGAEVSGTTLECFTGQLWTVQTPAEANHWQSVAYGNGLFVAVSVDGTNQVMTSPDGITWNARAAAEANNWNEVTYGKGLFVAVASYGTNRVMTSPDGITWTARAATEANSWNSITYGNGLFVAVSGGGTNRIMTSPDGITWTPHDAAAAKSWASVTYGDGLFVAVGGDAVMTSPDGENWTARTSAYCSNSWQSVTYGNGLFVAVDYYDVIMTSPDGITWTGAAMEIYGCISITYGNGLFVAVAYEGQGDKDIMTSPDGETWTTYSADCYNMTSVTYGNGLFVAVAYQGDNQVIISDCTSPAISVTTQATSDITSTTVTGNGTISQIGSGNATNRGVIHYPFTDSNLEIGGANVTNVDEDGDFGTGPFTASFTGLSVNTRYNARAHATNVGDGIAYGSRVDFWTLANVPSPPTVINPTATSLDLAVRPNGNPEITLFAIQDSALVSQYVQINGTRGVSAVWQTAAAWDTITVSGLETGITYYFRVKAKNGDDVETAFGLSTGQNTCANPTAGGSIGANQTICYGTKPSVLTNVTLPANYGGTLEYKWQFSTDSLSFADIVHDSIGYASGNLTETTWFKRVARVTCKNDWTGAAESNVVKIIVRPQFTAGAIVIAGETICYNGDPAIIGNSSEASGGDEDITYRWQSSTNAGFIGTPTDILNDDSSYNPPSGLTVDTWYRRQAKDGTCNTDWETSTGVWKVSIETVKPIAKAKDITIYLDDNGEATIEATDINDGSTDNCTIETVVASETDFTCADLGENDVTLTVTDYAGNFETDVAVVTIIDTITPVANAKNITIILDPNGNASITGESIDDGSTDNCSITLTASRTTFNCSDRGPNSVTLTVEDISGNTATANCMVTVLEGNTLLSPWENANTDVSANGAATYVPCDDGGTFRLTCTGQSSTMSDVYHYVYQELCGNGTIIARLDEVENGGWAGVMMRETNDSGSRAILIKTRLYNSSINIGYRTTPNKSMSNTSQVIQMLRWMKIQRNGSVFQVYTSVNGTNWTRRYTSTIAMNSCINAGIFTESIKSNRTSIALFDHVSLWNTLKTGDGTYQAEIIDLENEQVDVQIYPNPAKDVVNLNLTGFKNLSGLEATLLTTEGKAVKTITLANQQTELNIQDLKPGIYILRIENADNVVIKRVVIQ